MPIDDISLPAFVADNNRTQKVMTVTFYLVAGMVFLIEVEKFAGEVVDEFADLALSPGIFALIEVDGVTRAVQEFSNGVGSAFNAFHAW